MNHRSHLVAGVLAAGALAAFLYANRSAPPDVIDPELAAMRDQLATFQSLLSAEPCPADDIQCIQKETSE